MHRNTQENARMSFTLILSVLLLLSSAEYGLTFRLHGKTRLPGAGCIRYRVSASTVKMANVAYPVTLKQVVSRMTKMTQNALRGRNSRMQVELPPGVDFGVEIAKKSEGAKDIKKSNREAARLFGEMFQPLSSNLVVMFSTEAEAETARKSWGVVFRGDVLCIDAPNKEAKGYGKLRSRKFTLQEQEQALMANDGIYVPDGTEVLIFTAPRPKDWKKIKKVSEKFGDDTLVLVLNPRIDVIKEKLDEDMLEWIETTFLSVFHYAPPPLVNSKAIDDRDVLMYHEFDGGWSLAEKRDVKGLLGTTAKFETIWSGDEKPLVEDIPDLLNSEKQG